VQRLHPDTGAPLAVLPAAQSGGTTVASLRYRGAQLNTPVFDAMLGNTPVRVMLDSGNPAANIDHTWLATLQTAGTATPFSQMVSLLIVIRREGATPTNSKVPPAVHRCRGAGAAQTPRGARSPASALNP